MGLHNLQGHQQSVFNMKYKIVDTLKFMIRENSMQENCI